MFYKTRNYVFQKKEKPIYVYQPKAVTREIPQYLVSVQKRIWWFDKEDVTLSPVILNVSKMYSDKDFQTFWFRYKTEGEPHGISINSFCINQGVPYKQFYAWFKKHAKDTVIPVEIEGAPTDEETDDVEVPPQPASKESVN